MGNKVIYADGQHAEQGDAVSLDHGQRTGQVVEVIEEDAQMEYWGLSVEGLMIASEFYGLHFVSMNNLEDIRLTARE